jgi:hypothetical protein
MSTFYLEDYIAFWSIIICCIVFVSSKYLIGVNYFKVNLLEDLR